MDLFFTQFNSGPLSLETIKTLPGTDQAMRTVLQAKFKQHAQGRFFNERMATGIKKRKEYAEKQAERIKKRWNKYHGNTAVLPIIENEDRNENEDEDENENITGKNKTRKPQPLTIDHS